jgi:hypothetical protein
LSRKKEEDNAVMKTVLVQATAPNVLDALGYKYPLDRFIEVGLTGHVQARLNAGELAEEAKTTVVKSKKDES